MAANRNSKPNREGRAALVFGWILASGGNLDTFVGLCSRCGLQTTRHALAGVAGRPFRYFTLAHRDADVDPSYRPSALFACCHLCNASDGTARVGVHAIQPFARDYFGTDTRATSPDVTRGLAREAAILSEHGALAEAAASEAARLPL